MGSEDTNGSSGANAIFREAMRGVTRLQHDGLVPHRDLLTPAREFLTDIKGHTSMSSARALATNAGSGEEMVYVQSGLQRSLLRRLRRGGIRRELEIDLHGCRLAEAKKLLLNALQECLQDGVRCLLIIHGKGLRSPNGESILKRETASWLRLHPGVLAYCPALSRDGGSGALYVLLASSKTTA